METVFLKSRFLHQSSPTGPPPTNSSPVGMLGTLFFQRLRGPQRPWELFLLHLSMPGAASEVDMCGANKIWSLVPSKMIQEALTLRSLFQGSKTHTLYDTHTTHPSIYIWLMDQIWQTIWNDQNIDGKPANLCIASISSDESKHVLLHFETSARHGHKTIGLQISSTLALSAPPKWSPFCHPLGKRPKSAFRSRCWGWKARA